MSILRGIGLVAGLATTGLGTVHALTRVDPSPPSVIVDQAGASGDQSALDLVMVSTTFTGDPDPATTAPAAAAVPATTQLSVEASATATCHNDVVGFTVEYPAHWKVAGTDDDGPCVFFDPAPLDVPEASELPVAVVMYRADWAFNDLVAAYDGADLVVHEREDSRIAGHRAQRIRYTYTDEGWEPGASGYDVVVSLGGAGTLVISALEPYSDDFATTQTVVDAMAVSLTFDAD